jgi:hypothetical protein
MPLGLPGFFSREELTITAEQNVLTMEGAKPMSSKAQEYRARAAQCEQRAKKTRNPKDQEWQMVLASAYRRLADMECKAAEERRATAV